VAEVLNPKGKSKYKLSFDTNRSRRGNSTTELRTQLNLADLGRQATKLFHEIKERERRVDRRRHRAKAKMSRNDILDEILERLRPEFDSVGRERLVRALQFEARAKKQPTSRA
jgi:hypothetical protein